MKSLLFLLFHGGLLGLLLPRGSYTTTHPANPALQAEPEYCVPPLAYQYDPATAPLPTIEPLLDSALTARFSRRCLLVAKDCRLPHHAGR